MSLNKMSCISDYRKNPFEKVKSNIISLKNVSSSISSSTIISTCKEGEENVDDSKTVVFRDEEKLRNLNY